VFVLSESDGEKATINSISTASKGITLRQTSIKITYIGNDGVYISDGASAVIIDALPGSLAGRSPIESGVQISIQRGSVKFTNTKAALVTHAHGDHVSVASVNSFLAANSSAIVIAPSSITSSIISEPQISTVSPNFGQFEDVILGDIKVKVMHMKHFNAFGNNFSSVVNYSYLVEIGGVKILHLGDFEYSASNLEPFDLAAESIDIVLIPALSPFLNVVSKNVIDGINAKRIIALHLLSSTGVADVREIYPSAVVFKSSLEYFRY